MHASSDYWRHTFKVDLPDIQEMETISPPCQGIDNADLIMSCQMLSEVYNATEKLKLSAIESLSKLHEDIRDTIPEIFSTDQDSRSTRSILPFIGKLSQIHRTIFVHLRSPANVPLRLTNY